MTLSPRDPCRVEHRRSDFSAGRGQHLAGQRPLCSGSRRAAGTGVLRLSPRALEAVPHLSPLGRPVVLSAGDIVFQPRKIQRSGIWDAVKGRVMIYLHKERVLDHMQQRYPARHYVMVDDKPNLLAAMKSTLKSKLTTVFVRQGYYALAAESNSVDPAPDMIIERIGDLTP